jgi:hypothetical protein
MMNAGDLFVCLVAGLALPLALLDGIRAISRATSLADRPALRLDGWPVLWISSLILGPGLFVERMLAAWRSGELSVADQINAMVIAFGWAAIYGFVVLEFTRRAFAP